MVALFYSLSLQAAPVSSAPTTANHWLGPLLRLGLLIFRLHSLKHQLKWFLLNPVAPRRLPTAGWAITHCMPLVAPPLECSFSFLFSPGLAKMLIKRAFQLEWFPLGALPSPTTAHTYLDYFTTRERTRNPLTSTRLVPYRLPVGYFYI